jgi:hypothetical protein
MSTTLHDTLLHYLGLAHGLQRAPTLRHRVSCWSRFVSAELPVTTERINDFRRLASQSGLSPATIETTIGDVMTLLRHTNQDVPDRGRRLPAPPNNAEQPTLVDVGRVYEAASDARWPVFTIRDRIRREWRDEERQRLFRSFIFVSFWTGLRVGDLRELSWKHVRDDRIEWTASKTQAQHSFPITVEVKRHLDMARGLDRSQVFPIAKGSVRFVREELDRLCRVARVDRFGPQMIRRASITNWYCTDQPKAGDIVHGSGLVKGITGFYAEPLRILSKAAETFVLPDEMQDPATRGKNRDAIARLLRIVKRMKPDEIHRLARTAEVW